MTAAIYRCRAYRRPKSERSRSPIRLQVAEGPAAGLKVSFSHAARIDWQPGDRFTVTGRIVQQPNGPDYIRALTVEIDR